MHGTVAGEREINKDIFLCPVPVLELLALIAFGACKAL
jgi:hypothetical protein